MSSSNLPNKYTIKSNYKKFKLKIFNHQLYNKLIHSPIHTIIYYVKNDFQFEYKNNVKFFFVTGSELLWPWQYGYLDNFKNILYYSICISGGSLSTCISLCNIDINEIIDEIKEYMLNNYTYSLNKKLLILLENLLYKKLPNDAHVICNGRMSILIRNINSNSFLVDFFESKKMLINVIITACSIPLLTSDLYGKRIYNNYFCDHINCNNIYNYQVVNPNNDIDIPIPTYYWPNDVNKIKLLYNYGQAYSIKSKNNLIKQNYFIICMLYLKCMFKYILLFLRILINIIQDI